MNSDPPVEELLPAASYEEEPRVLSMPARRSGSSSAEEAVLGACLIDSGAFARVAPLLRASDFMRGAHRLIWAAMEVLSTAATAIDPVTLAEQLDRREHLKAAGGLAYLSKIARETPTAANAEAYAEALRDAGVRRRLEDLLGEAPRGAELAAGIEQALGRLKGSASVELVPRFDPQQARARASLLDDPPDTVERIAGDFLRRTAGVRASAGGAGKSTLTLHEAVQIILGGDLYGHEVMRPGPCLLVTAEDERQVVEYRLWRILDATSSLSRAQREQVLGNLYIEDLTTRPLRFVDVGLNGSLVQTPAVEELIERYRGIGLSFVSIDPMIFFGPGERFVNDGEGELLRAGRRISAGLNAAVRFEHHTGKAQARERSTDQYTGRGGSAGADNARFVHILQVHEADDKLAAPKGCSSEDIAKGNVLRLHVAKDSYGARLKAPIWILRTGFLFTHLKPGPAEEADPMQEQLRKLYGFIESEGAIGIRHTPNSLDNRLKEIGLSRQELRAALHVALERKHLVEQPLPKEEQHARRRTYLAKGLRP